MYWPEFYCVLHTVIFFFFLIKLHLNGLQVWIFKGAEEKQQFYFCSIDITFLLLPKTKVMEVIWPKAQCNQSHCR